MKRKALYLKRTFCGSLIFWSGTICWSCTVHRLSRQSKGEQKTFRNKSHFILFHIATSLCTGPGGSTGHRTGNTTASASPTLLPCCWLTLLWGTSRPHCSDGHWNTGPLLDKGEDTARWKHRAWRKYKLQDSALWIEKKKKKRCCTFVYQRQQLPLQWISLPDIGCKEWCINFGVNLWAVFLP